MLLVPPTTIVTLVPAMILGPMAAGVGLFWLKPDHFRKILVGAATIAICCCALVLPRPTSRH